MEHRNSHTVLIACKLVNRFGSSLALSHKVGDRYSDPAAPLPSIYPAEMQPTNIEIHVQTVHNCQNWKLYKLRGSWLLLAIAHKISEA